ncbi:hypothetical protein C8J57DRAFT_1433589 [Mycena rebaudengoi]|nr:hypothetical protein C8J57DRAFT_1433589 [Mycena rebaudengoi]
MSSDECAAPPSPPKPPTEPAAMAMKKRPRLDLSEPQKRKRGGMFGLLLGTLNKAKIEDKERSASEAAKKRQLIDQRLQTKLRKETDSVRRAEEARKDKLSANRKEEDLQLKDSIYKLRKTRLPLLANFLLTSDIIPASSSDEDPAPLPLPLATVPCGHPPPIYYLPAVLTPAQASYIKRRKAQVTEAVDAEYGAFQAERAAGVTEVLELRKTVAEEEERKRVERAEAERLKEDAEDAGAAAPIATDPKPATEDIEMGDADDDSATVRTAASKEAEEEAEKKDDAAMQGGDDDDAVEY